MTLGRLRRTAAIAVLLIILANPSLVEEQRDPQRDVAIVLVDESSSQRIGERRRYTEEAIAHVTEKLGGMRDLDVRVVRVGNAVEGAGRAGGTQLFAALNRALAGTGRLQLVFCLLLSAGILAS